MLTLEMLEKMLLAAAVELEEKSKMLCELDSVAGDGDHGVTIARMAESMKKGEIIGYVGSTGYSTGPHLHFEVIHYGEQVDPSSLM